MLDHPSFRSSLVKLITTEFLLAVSEVFVAVVTVPELDPEKSLGYGKFSHGRKKIILNN